MPLRFGPHQFPDSEPLIMGIVNRTPDSFYDQGRTFSDNAAHQQVDAMVEAGAHIIDIGGVKAGPGPAVDISAEIDRTAAFIAEVRQRHPRLVISIDTWRAPVAAAALEAGADVVNDAWGGWDPELARVAAKYQAGLVCTHAGGSAPRTRPFRVEFDDVMADIIAVTTDLANQAMGFGVPRESILVDPGHDFGKNTFHSLEATRRLAELVATGWPVLVSLSNKDFVGESLGVPVGERLTGTLATTAVCAWLGARVFRVHNVSETRQTLEMISCIRGDRKPVAALRGLV